MAVHHVRFATAAALIFAITGATAAAPLAGCYERSYDPAHLAKHKGQFVTRVRLLVKASSFGAGFPPIDGHLEFWVAGHSRSFTSHGACEVNDGALDCGGSLSAAEADECETRRDGVRDCREGSGDSGSFRVAPQGNGVLVSVTARLEVPESNDDAGPPFLYLDPRNTENHDFLLPKAAAAACSSLDR